MKNVRSMRVLIAGIVVFSFIIGAFACRKPEKAQTVIDKPLPSDAFKADISVNNPPASMKASSVSTIAVNVKNTGASLWPARGQAGGAYSINLSYHWLDKDDKVVVWDGTRTSLPHDVKPGEEVTLNASIRPPDTQGDYILEFDMVQERVSWFSRKGATKTLSLPIKVDQ